MSKMQVEIGEHTAFSKTVTDADIALFSAISGDFDPVHVDEEYARKTPFGRRIAHGIFVLGLLSAAESEMSRRIVARGSSLKPVTLGYDRIRFIKPVFVGDTLTATYTIVALDPDKARSTGKCEVTNQKGELCLVGEHIMKWV
ncbi:MAG: MaoC family dehydratase [Rhodospirillales bacterium]|jgi:acyl dehydratase|nr:MaoC family dehydratase [Rhodospirillales bacterium]